MNLLKFLRLPGAFTAAADILAGFFIIRFSGLDYERVGYLPNILGASLCLYLAGMAWNDLFDAPEDALFRPQRPLPAGKLSTTTGFITAAILTAAGLMLLMTAGMPTFLIGSLLLLLIFMYNAGLKKVSFLGPLIMGACRGLNLFLGMCAHTYILLLTDDPRVFIPPLITFCYITVITVLSGMESDGQVLPEQAPVKEDLELSTEVDLEKTEKVNLNDPVVAMRHSDLRRKHDLQILLQQNRISHTPIKTHDEGPLPPPEPEALFLWSGAALTLAVIPAAGFLLSFNWLSWLLAGMLGAYLFKPVYAMLLHKSGESIKRVVGAGVSGICLLDAALAASMAEFAPDQEVIIICAVIAGLILPTVILRRYIDLS